MPRTAANPVGSGRGRSGREFLAPLRRPDFRRFFLARTVSQWGDTFNSVAILVLVYQLSGSGLRVGAAVMVELLPVLAVGWIAGAVVDRLSRRSVMVVSDLARAVIAALLVVDHSDLAVLYLGAFGLAVFNVFFNPAAASVVPALVAPDEVLAANATVWSTAVLSQILLAPLAGGLIAVAGAGPAFAVNAASFLLSAALLAGLRLPRRSSPSSGRGLADVWGGLRCIRADRFLRTLALVQCLAALSAGATSALLVVLVGRKLHAGPDRFGLLLGAIGVGAGFGPVAFQRLVRQPLRSGWIFGSYTLRGLVDLTLAASPSFALDLAALGTYGIGTSVGSVVYSSTLQTVVPDELRGRVFAAFDVVWQAARLASVIAGGILVDRLGVAAVYVSGGTLLLVASGVGFAWAGQPTRIVTAPNGDVAPRVGAADRAVDPMSGDT